VSEFHLKPMQPTVNFDDAAVASLADVDKLLITADATLYRGRRNAMVIGMAIAHIVRQTQEPVCGLRYLEGRYRALASPTHLVAAPKSVAPPNTEPRSLRTGRLTKYHLWVCVNGAREAEDMLMKFEIHDATENLNRLDDTGMLVLKQAK
jgi:hypothetical protein